MKRATEYHGGHSRDFRFSWPQDLIIALLLVRWAILDTLLLMRYFHLGKASIFQMEIPYKIVAGMK